MFANCKNSKKQGDLGLATAIRYFSSVGATVLIPLTDSQDYDLVVEDDAGELYKVQVKTTGFKKCGKFVCNLRVMGGNRRTYAVAKYADQLSYDLLFILTAEGKTYLIPKSELKVKNSVTLGKKYDKFLI